MIFTPPRAKLARVFALLVAHAMLSLTACAQSPRATLNVDATDIPRRLLTARMELPVRPGALDLNFVEWTPGNHNPSGPIQNVVDLTITDDRGRRVQWTRDPEKMTRLNLDVPDGVSFITVDFAYITNQPSVVSRSTDSYGFPTFGGMNWNTVLFYPGDVDKDEFIIEPTLRLPDGWTHATSLDVAQESRGEVLFEAVSLAELVDSPVIFGSELRTYTLDTQLTDAPHYIHAVAPFASQTELGAERLEKFGDMVDEAIRVFGPFPYDEFHFLVMLSDDLPGLGVEHNESTFIAFRADRFINAEKDGDPIGTIPHEYIHAWCGKQRAPEGLLARDYHTTADTRLLWVYEGLTSYYDDVIATRVGLMTASEYRDGITSRLADYQHRSGREWRSVEDTAVFLRYLRSRSKHWYDKRRGTSYYSEGALFWMDADAIIRLGTNNERSLDDFCRAFFDVDVELPGTPITYTRADIVNTLRSVYDGEDWDALIRARIETPLEDLSFDHLATKLGYTFEFSNEPTAEQEKDIRGQRGVDLRYSLGFSTDRDGVITRILPGSIADEYGLAYDMRILAVNDYIFNPRRLRDAVDQSPANGHVTLLVEFGDRVEKKLLLYDGGPKYPRFVENVGAPLVLKAIIHSN